MKFKELILKYNFQEIKTRMLVLYPDQDINIDGYEHVFNKLKVMEPVNSSMLLDIFLVSISKWNEEEYTSVSGLIEGEEIGYAIEYTKWNEWLGMELTENSLIDYSELDIITHCLWEMTWTGFEEEEIEEYITNIEDNNVS